MIRILFAVVALAVSVPAFAESSHNVTVTTVNQSGGTTVGVVTNGAPAPAAAAQPSKLSHEDMLELELDGYKFAEMDRASAELRAHRDAILKRYGVKADDVGRTVAIMADGTIKRADPPPAAAPVPAPTKPTKIAKRK
jgi:hypothetical protein